MRQAQGLSALMPKTLDPLHLKALQILLFQQTGQGAGNKSYACKANDVL